MMKIYDCFLFFNELEMLDIRLNVHSPFVDFFVLCESSHTHSGNPKPFYYEQNKQLFTNFKHKIIHLKFDVIDFVNRNNLQNSWTHSPTQENWHRRFLQEYIKRLCYDDLILFTDVDEIIRPEKFYLLSQIEHSASIGMGIYHYFFNFKLQWDWFLPKVFRQKIIYDFLEDNNYVRGLFSPKEIFSDCGWHWSYFLSMEDIVLKIKSFAHHLDYEGDWSNSIFLQRMKDNLINMFHVNSIHRHIKGEIVPLDVPSYIFNNIEKFEKYIYKEL